MYASDFPHWDFDEPEQTLRQLPAEWRDNVRWRNAARVLPAARAGARCIVSAAAREARLPLDEAPAEGSVRIVEIGGRRIGLYRVGRRAVRARRPLPASRRAALRRNRRDVDRRPRTASSCSARRNGTLRCPWHKWEFDIASGRALADDRLRVRRYAVRVDGAEIVVSLDAPSAG